MLATVDLLELAPALALCAGVPKRGTIPILENALLVAKAGSLAITTTNLDYEITARATARIETEGSITVPVATLANLAKAFPSGAQAEIELKGGKLQLRCGSSTYRLPTLAAADFPRLKIDACELGGDIDAEVLKRLLTKAKPHACSEEARRFLQVVHVRGLADGWLRAEATDGKGAAAIDAQMREDFVAPEGLPIPISTVEGMLKLLERSKGLCSFRMSDRGLSLDASEGELVSRLVEGRFPSSAFEGILTAERGCGIEVDRVLLTSALRRIGLLADDGNRSMALVGDETGLTVTAQSVQFADGVERLDAEVTSPFEIKVNARLFDGIVRELAGKRVQLKIGDPREAILITSDDDALARFVLMPHVR